MFLPSCNIDLDEYFIYEFQEHNIDVDDDDNSLFRDTDDDEDDEICAEVYKGDVNKYNIVKFKRSQLTALFRTAKRGMFRLLFVREHR